MKDISKNIVLPQEALGLDFNQLTPELYKKMGQVSNILKNNSNYEKDFSLKMKSLKKNENILFKKRVHSFMFDALEREYYFRKATTPKNMVLFLSKYFYQTMLALVKNDVEHLDDNYICLGDTEKYKERLIRIFKKKDRK